MIRKYLTISLEGCGEYMMRNIKCIYLLIVMILLGSFILIACRKEASVNETIKDMEGKDDITKVVETEDNTETDKAEDKDTSKDKDSKI